MKKKARNEGRPGYKETKVGWIPEEWEVKMLGSFGSFSKGKGIPNSEKNETGLPCITYGEIYTTHDYVIKDFCSFIDKEAAKKSQRIQMNDILFAGTGETLDEIGKCVAFTKEVEAYAGGDIVIFHPHNVNSVFLSHSLNSDFIIRYRRKLGQGQSVVHIYSSTLKTLKIPLPPLPEQKKIAEILSAWDRAIEQVGRLIDAKKQLKKGLMQKLLTGRIRFSEFGKPVDKKGQLPEGWREVKLGELGKIHSGGTPDTKKTDYWNGDIPWLTPSEVTILKSRFISDTLKKITEKGLKNSSASLLPEKSILVCTRATVGDCAINIVPMTTNQGFKNIELSSGYDADFVYYSICSIKKRFKRFSAGSTFFEVPMRDFIKIRLEIPPLLEQTRIAAVLSACDREIELLKKKKERLQEQKKGLMQKLLTGEIRVK